MKFPNLSEDEILNIVEPIMDSCLEGSNEGDHKKHTKDFTDRMKSIVTPEELKRQLSIEPKIFWTKREFVCLFRRSDSVGIVWKQKTSSSNDEFAVIMEGDIRIELRTIEASIPNPNRDGPGSTTVSPNDLGKKMGVIKLRRGHQALLPQGSAYRFSSESPGVILIQTLCGPLTQEKWSRICQQ